MGGWGSWCHVSGCVWRVFSSFVSSSSWYWLMDLGVGVVEMGDEKGSESLSSAQITSII